MGPGFQMLQLKSSCGVEDSHKLRLAVFVLSSVLYTRRIRSNALLDLLMGRMVVKERGVGKVGGNCCKRSP